MVPFCSTARLRMPTLPRVATGGRGRPAIPAAAGVDLGDLAFADPGAQMLGGVGAAEPGADSHTGSPTHSVDSSSPAARVGRVMSVGVPDLVDGGAFDERGYLDGRCVPVQHVASVVVVGDSVGY